MFKRIAKKIIGNTHFSFSQNGEDILLGNIFRNKSRGFYVDVGAHHPTRFSNTNLLYMKGWSGINIDATPGSMDLFKKNRKNDINLEMAISDRNQDLIIYMFSKSPLNTLSRKLAESYENQGHKIIGTKKLTTSRLEDVLDKNLKTSQQIDLLSVDAEDLDIDVLRSNDWQKYRPTIVLVEDLDFDYNNAEKSHIFNFMVSKGYRMMAFMGPSLFFQTK